MSRFLRWLAGVLVLVLAAGALWMWWPSEERRVRARLTSLAESLSVPARETDFERLARAQRVRAGLLDALSVEFEAGQWPPLAGRDAVAGLVARPWAATSGGVRVDVEDLEIQVAEDAARAEARFKARVTALDQSPDQSTLDGRLVSVTLHRVDGEWLVASARIMKSDDAMR